MSGIEYRSQTRVRVSARISDRTHLSFCLHFPESAGAKMTLQRNERFASARPEILERLQSIEEWHTSSKRSVCLS